MKRIEKKNPLKQGLKQQILPPLAWAQVIEKKNPLKQGLKPEVLEKQEVISVIEKKNPLKQGLKQLDTKLLGHISSD